MLWNCVILLSFQSIFIRITSVNLELKDDYFWHTKCSISNDTFLGDSKTWHFRDILVLQRKEKKRCYISLNLMITLTDSCAMDNVWILCAQSLIRIEIWKSCSDFMTSTIPENAKIFDGDRCKWFIVIAWRCNSIYTHKTCTPSHY